MVVIVKWMRSDQHEKGLWQFLPANEEISVLKMCSYIYDYDYLLGTDSMYTDNTPGLPRITILIIQIHR